MQSITPWLKPSSSGLGGGAVRAARGLAAHASGHSAERIVAGHYTARGGTILEQCWRSAAGEVDLIVRDGNQTIFVEVKRAGTHDVAAARLGRRQMDRICMAALLYADGLPAGSLSDLRFDVALVDSHGAVQVIENAFGVN